MGFEPTTTEFRSDTLTDWAIRPLVQLAFRANFVQLLHFHHLFNVWFHFGYYLRQSPRLYFPSHVLPFIKHLKITLVQSSTQTKIKLFIVQSLSFVKGFHLAREMLKCTIEFSKWIFPETFLFVVYTFHIKLYFSRKRQRKSTTNLSKTCHWNLTFVIWSYSMWALGHAKRVSMQGMWAHKLARHIGTKGMLAHKAHKHIRHMST